MKLNQKVYILDYNKRKYDSNKTIVKEAHIQEVDVVRETTQSFIISYYGKEYRYSKKDSLIKGELYGIQPYVFEKREDALNYLKPPKKEEVKENKTKNYTLIKCKNGKEIKLEHRYLDDGFCEEALDWAEKNSVIPMKNTFFNALGIENYIRETGIDPIYES